MNSTRTKLKVATTATIGDCKVTLSKSSPAGPRTAPSARKTPTCGRSLRSMRPEQRCYDNNKADEGQGYDEEMGIKKIHALFWQQSGRSWLSFDAGFEYQQVR